MRMEKNNDELSQNSTDLLSAALNQSGLTMLDSPPVSINDDSEDLLASLMTTIKPNSNDGNLHVTSSVNTPQIVKPLSKQQQKTISSIPVSAYANVVKTSVNTAVIKASNVPKVITIGGNGLVQKPISRIVTITNANGKNPTRIFKVSLPDKSKTGNGPCIIKLPIGGKGNGSNLPILISKQSLTTSAVNKFVSTKNTPKIVKAIPNTVIARTAIVPPTHVTLPSSAHKVATTAILTSRSASPCFVISKRATTVEIKHIVANDNKTRKQQTVLKTNMRKSNLTTTDSNNANDDTLSKNGLNLGSLFVENAENSTFNEDSTLNVLSPSENIHEDGFNNNFFEKFNSTNQPKLQTIFRQQSVPVSLCDRFNGGEFHPNHKLSDLVNATLNETKNKSKNATSPKTSQPLNDPSVAEASASTPKHSVPAKKFYKTEVKSENVDEKKPPHNEAYKRNVQKNQDDLLLDEEQKEEESGHANTYAEYIPSKLHIGLPHPDSVVETSSLASVPPPDVHYKLCIPEETIDHGLLSALQLEAITYGCQQNQVLLPSGERAGFLIGDGAGVGKGRTIAGIIYENYLIGRKKSLWFSVSNDLKYDAERDLRDIGAKIKVYPLSKFKYGKISSRENGVVKKGVVFATYSSLIGESHKSGKYATRLKQILQWCGKDFDGPIVFDECHKAKNLVQSGSNKSTKTGLTVLELQKLLPKARVIYASATGASEPKNMAYMSRLGLWGPGTPFKHFNNFIQAVERRGVGAMEMVAMDLKLRGSYMARQLSFHGVSFKITEVELPSSFIRMYNQCVKLWVAAREAFQLAAQLMDAEYHMKKTMWGQFWSAHQRFFKYLCIASKVNQVSHQSREAVKHGKCVVIGLQSTGEARTMDQLEKQGGELDDFVSTAKGVFENLIEKHFPAPNRKRITELLGKDFYGRNTNKGGKRKLEGKNDTPAKRSNQSMSHMSDNDSSSEEDEENQLPSFLQDSMDSSDEDIGKIFGGGSDSEEEWGSVSPKPKKNKPSIKKQLNEDEEADKLLEACGLKAGFKKTEVVGMNEMGDVDDEDGLGVWSCLNTSMTSVEKAQALKKHLLDKLELLDRVLPNNTLDQLIDALGGQENVAEMTGRRGRVVSTMDGGVQYESRSENDVKVDMLNMAEKQRFMDGEKNIAIISEAASSGISLQADRRVRNQRKRVHFTLELPWSADKAIQQFGRTHRSNQVHAPEYIFLISQLAGEQRFASIVAKRLESLGALTHGDRRATETRDFSKYNFDNKYGRVALESILKAILELEEVLVPTPEAYGNNFMEDIRKAMVGVGLFAVEEDGSLQLDKDYGNISKFMNRILGMEVAQQNALFQFFTDTLQHIIKEVKKQGQYDRGILDLGSSGETVERLNVRKFRVKTRSVEQEDKICGYVELHTLKVERGMPWNEAEKLWNDVCDNDDDGFYITQLKRHGKCMAVLAVEYFNKRWKRQDADARLFTLYRPSTSKQIKLESLSTLQSKYRKVPASEAEIWWKKQYEASSKQCTHAYWQGMCFRFVQGDSCNVGKRQRTCHILSGNVLAVWNLVEHVLSYGASTFHKMQIIRLELKTGKLVGLLIPSNCVPALILSLNKSTSTKPNAVPPPLPTLARSQSTPQFNKSHVNRISELADEGPSDEELVESDEDDISPDDMNLSVLFPKKY